MKKIKYLLLQIILFSVCISCKAQKPKVIDFSNYQEMNYTLANIWSDNTYYKELFNGDIYVKIFQMNDSKATPEGYFEETHGVLDSFMISVLPDGEYVYSKLYKIERMLSPKILEIKETKYPKFSIKIEHGFPDNRKTDIFEFEGVQ